VPEVGVDHQNGKEKRKYKDRASLRWEAVYSFWFCGLASILRRPGDGSGAAKGNRLRKIMKDGETSGDPPLVDAIIHSVSMMYGNETEESWRLIISALYIFRFPETHL
jgi:hypothetical protein